MPFVGFMGAEIPLLKYEFGTVTQLVPRPTFGGLVWICNCQPVWSAGQENWIWPPALCHPNRGGTKEGAEVSRTSSRKMVLSPPLRSVPTNAMVWLLAAEAVNVAVHKFIVHSRLIILCNTNGE